MAATQGHTQSLHTNALDEAIALPTDFSRPDRPQHPAAAAAGVGHDPASSTRGAARYYVERLTHDLAARAWAHIQEVEEAGGMAKAIEEGMPEAAHRGGRGPHPGPDRLRPPAGDRRQQVPARRRRDRSRCCKVDNAAVRAAADRQARAAARRARRRRRAGGAGRADRAAAGAEHRRLSGNLLALAVDAARAKATVGEISDALEKVFGRHAAEIRTISGVYRDEAGERRRRRRSARATVDAVRARPRAAARASWSPRWARTATTAARRSSPPRSPTSASTSTSARCSRRPRRSPGRRSRPTCTSSASRRWRPGT